MKKSLLFSSAVVTAIAFGIIGMSAFEAHIINVTAKIEDALRVNTASIDFGTAFPQEALDANFDMNLSDSFLEQSRVNTVNYIIRQKPKCWSEGLKKYGLVSENENNEFVCADGGDYQILPVLCPYLSKHEITSDGQAENDSPGINAFHGPATGWTLADTLATQVSGQLVSSSDILDQWNIDFRVPCFGGQCAQDWEDFVIKNNPNANPDSYILPADLEHKLFGCDLWVEVTGINNENNNNGAACTVNSECTDDNACTIDTCNAQHICEHPVITFADNNPCTLEYCDEVTGVQYPFAPDGTACALAFAGTCQEGLCTEPRVDTDGDGILDNPDNCVTIANSDQADADLDGIGDVCDEDIDGDSYINALDCAPDNANINPGENEECSDQIDNNCNGFVDCGDEACSSDEACQTPSNGHKTMRLENKDGSWNPIIDGTYADLTYNQSGPTFDWTLNAVGISGNTQYRLVYIPDPWPQGIPPSYNIKTEIKTFTTDNSGSYYGSGSTELNLDLPDSRDANFGINYAKVWIVPASIHDTYKMTSWNMPATLFDTQSVNYDDTDVASTKTIMLNDLGSASQYGYYHNYAGANVTFAYTSPAVDKISGTLTATGLKPYATYQLKFEGQPTCKYGAAGDDTANEYIGYKGRWWDNTTNSNTNDAGYIANHTTHCITGYLVWGYITADASGNATKVVQTDSSYHVLWCGGGTCGTANNTFLSQPDPAHPTLNLCAPDKVEGELERGSCGTMTFNSGNYKLDMILNEESFHQGPGTWTAVMHNTIEFKIN